MNALKKLSTFTPLLAVALPVVAQAQTPPALASKVAALDSKVENHEKRLAHVEAEIGSRKEAPVVETKTPPPAYKTVPYTIREGDTLGEISRRNNIRRELLLEVNGMKEGQNIYIGDVLQIPVGQTNPPPAADPVVSPVPAPAPGATPAPAPGPKNTPPNVADKKPNAPKPVPTPEVKPKPSPSPSASQNHVVKSGDTLYSISRRYKVSVDAIKKANKLRGDRLNLGQNLKIPGKNSVAQSSGEAPASGGADRVKGESYGAYVVQKGDTLYSLSVDFFTTQAELQRLNKMGSSTSLAPGKELIVPTSKYLAAHQLATND